MQCIHNKKIQSFTTRGFTLFYAVLITSLLLSLALAVFNITLKELILSSDARESQNAFFAADTALECALYWDNASSPAFGFYGDSLASGISNYWRFDEDEDEDVYDTGSASNDGLLLPSGNGPIWTTGYINSALSFDGIDDYVGLDTTASYAGAFTVAMWIRPSFNSGTQLLLAGANDGDYGRLGFQYNGLTGRNDLRVAIGSGFFTPNITYASSLGGSWNHLVLRRDGADTVNILINGGAEILTPGTKSGTFDFSVIGKNPGGANYYTGDIDDVRVYNRALSDAEVLAMYNGNANNIFVDPVPQLSNVLCAGADISDPETGWNTDGSGDPIGWDTVVGVDSAETTFDISFDNDRCAYVTVSKDTASTTIVSRGYNTCDLSSSRRLERALRAEY